MIVFRHAVCVAQPAAPGALTWPFFELDRHCVVLALPTRGRLVHEDVSVLGERPQQLAALNRRGASKFARPSNAEEGVGNRLTQSGGVPCSVRSREQLPRHRRIDLIDVDRAIVRAAEADVAPGRADVADRHGHVARQLALNVRGVLMHAR